MRETRCATVLLSKHHGFEVPGTYCVSKEEISIYRMYWKVYFNNGDHYRENEKVFVD